MKKVKPSWIDNSIGVFSPKRRLNRLRFKLAADLLQRKYEGASVGRRTKGWRTTSSDANTEISSSISNLRDRSRDLIRNNPYAARGVQVIQSNVVGKGILGEIKHPTKRTEAKLRDMWNAWTMTTAVDFNGRHNFFGLQNMIMRSVAESGQVFVRLQRTKRRQVRARSGELIEVPPIQLQVLESDFLDSNNLFKTQEKNGNQVIQGIEFDKKGKRVSYQMFQTHPGALDSGLSNSFSSNKIPADLIAHIYREDRPGQILGVPWLAPVLIRLRDLDEYEDAQLLRQKIANLFVGFIHDTEGIEDSTTEDCELVEKMEPGTLEILPPGKDITFANPPGVGEEFESYMSVVLHSIATGLGISFESLTGDLSKVNFSSARMGFLEMNRNIDSWRWTMFTPQLLEQTFDWFLRGAELLGVRTRGASIVWTPPKREMVDPTKEVPAQIKAIRGGLMTLSEAVRQSGKDPDKHFEEFKADNDRLDGLQLTLDSDPRKDVQQVNSQGANGTSNKSGAR